MTGGFGRVAAMQQHNMLLAILCQHMDIKASIFLSFVAAMLFAYSFGTWGNPFVFVLALAFAVAYPIRIGAKMLMSRPARAGGVFLEGRGLGGDGDAGIQKRLMRSYGAAIRSNTGLLREKHRDNRAITVTSLLLFAYIMIMTAVVRFIESPGPWASFPA